MVQCEAVAGEQELPLKPAADEDEVSTEDEASSGEEALYHYSKRFAEAFEGDCQVARGGACQAAGRISQAPASGYDVPADLYPFLGLDAQALGKAQEAQRRAGAEEQVQDDAKFCYAGNLDKQPPMAMFDIRDEVCLRVGGFKHGQVVRDSSGGELIVIGVKPVDGALRLWFQPKDLGRAGAGAFPEATAEELRARFSLVTSSRAAKTAGGRQLREVSPTDFDVVEDVDGEQMCLCSHCRLPLGDFECLSSNKNAARVHGECLAQLMLRSLQEESEAREKEQAALKKSRRAEYDIGWRAEHIPRGLELAKGLGCSHHGMFCLALDADTNTLRVAPTIEPAASVNLEYLALALQVRLSEGREPFFSLDPVDPCNRASMQEKRFEPAWLAGTSAGEVLFQADYHLKELSMGEYMQPVVGMKSCLDLSAEEGEFGSWSAREWFVVRHAEVQLSEDRVLVPSLQMGVEAREQVVGPNGMEDVRVTRPDHPLVKYAEAFTERFDLIAERKSVVHHLRELAKASVLAKFLLDGGVELEDAWFNLISSDKDACCLEIPQLWNERYNSQIRVQDGKIVDAGKAGYNSIVNGVYGGVEFGIDKFDLSQPTQNWRLRSVVAPSMPTMGLRLPAPRSVAAPVLETAVARAARMVPTARGVPEAAVAVPRFSKRIKGVGAARGVDLNLDEFDLSAPGQVAATFQASGDSGCLGGAFWSSLADGGNSVFEEEDRTLLKRVFNPHLSDRHDEGDRFVPPDSSLAYVEGLRGLVKKEDQVRQMRKGHFLSAAFSQSSPGPLFPAAWAASVEVAAGEAEGEELHARADYMAAVMVFEQAMKSAAPAFDKTAEDGMRFRVYRFGSVEVRSTQECEGREVVGAIFSARAPRKAAPSVNVKEETIVRVTEYVESAEAPAASHSYVVLETASGRRIASERRADEAVAWEEEPKDLEGRNSLAKLVRSAALPEALSVLEARAVLLAQEAVGASPCEQKQFAQGAFCYVAGIDAASGFRRPAKPGKWQLSMEGQGGWRGAGAQRCGNQAIRVRCGK